MAVYALVNLTTGEIEVRHDPVPKYAARSGQKWLTDRGAPEFDSMTQEPKVGPLPVSADAIDVPYEIVSLPVDEVSRRRNSSLVGQIRLLEETQTPRRMRDALPDESGGTAEGRAWMINLNNQIVALRAQFT